MNMKISKSWGGAPSRIALVVGLFLILILAAMTASLAYASGEKTIEPSQRLITIHDRDEKKVVLTRAKNLADVFNEAGIEIDEHDIVEPSLTEELVASDYQVNVYRAKPVIVVDGMMRQKMMAPYQNARDIAKHLELDVRDEDELTLGRSTDIISDGAGMRLEINRATPFTLVLYGKSESAYTQAQTVRDMLEEKGITLADSDTLSVDEDAKLKSGMKIEIWREGVQTVTEEVEIDFPVEQIQDADREVGFREVRTVGIKGMRTVTYEIEMRNGEEVSRREIQSVTTRQPKKQIEVVGAKPTFSGEFADALAELRSCEGGYDSWNPAGPYYGAYQFDRQTWGTVADPSLYGNATPAQQDQAARALYERRGWQPWPHCGAKLPDIYR